MALSNVVFNKNPEREIEVMGKKIVIRSITTKDTLEMNVDYTAFLMSEEDANSNFDIKKMLVNVIEMLSSTIVSIDGEKPESRQEMKEFLLNQEQEVVLAIFKEANKGNVSGEVKN